MVLARLAEYQAAGAATMIFAARLPAGAGPAVIQLFAEAVLPCLRLLPKRRPAVCRQEK